MTFLLNRDEGIPLFEAVIAVVVLPTRPRFEEVKLRFFEAKNQGFPD
jgi:hypothetical protein